jgi:hypothetical protein
MKNFHRFLTLSVFVALTGAVAQAGVPNAGDYKLTTGSEPACTLTLAADGSAQVGACMHLASAGKWRPTSAGFQLDDHAGTLIAVFHTTSDGYKGKEADGSRSYELAPASQTAASH